MSNWREKLSRLLLREPHSQSQLIDILHEALDHNLIDLDALRMIEGVLKVSEKKAHDIMVPRPQMVVIDANATPKDIMPIIIQSQHSRFPVIDETRDKIIGVLLAKDLLPFALEARTQNTPVRALIRPPTFIPETKRLDSLLKEFRANHYHMAIVVDEFGGVAGLITIEDVLEEIVGDIKDEYDIDEKENWIQVTPDDTYLVNALTPIHRFNDYFQIKLSDENCDTIGGLLLQQFGHLPKRGEVAVFHGFQITVLKATHRGIQLLQFKKV